MIFRGYKIRVRCSNWEQVDCLGKFWQVFTSRIKSDRLVGLGMNWADDGSFFDYAIGTINDDDTFRMIGSDIINNSEFNMSYAEIALPGPGEWTVFHGKEKDLQKIYDTKIDIDNRPYDYELEYIDGKGNLTIKIHYTDA